MRLRKEIEEDFEEEEEEEGYKWVENFSFLLLSHFSVREPKSAIILNY
jgi:hypothetical protein